MKSPLIILLTMLSIVCYGQKSAQLKELESQRKAVEKEIETTTSLLAETKESAQRSLARLNLLSAQITQRKQMIELLNREITATENDIAETRHTIAVLEKDLHEKQERYGNSLRLIQKHRKTQDKLLFIFSASGFAQSLRRIHFLRQYASRQRSQAADLTKRQKEIITKIAELQAARDDKQQLLIVRENEYSKIEEDEAIQKQYVSELNRQQGELQRELQLKQRRADLLSRQIAQQIADEVARERDTRRLDTQLGNDRSEAIAQGERLSENFAASRGLLAPPLNKAYTIVRDYGEQTYPNLPYVRTNNNGIDLQTTADANACAVFEGEVRTIFSFSQGFSIIVRHGNYLTVYSNIKDLYVGRGDRVKARQPLGKLFADDDSDRSATLHFELWLENEKQNPRPWIGQ
ncbi:MAG: peptidoglycan DD-metalloendopeptidase family protein [Tannerellaceae bacterium]|jgi:septal ring factor EnvC (AmiA/AmiB activator)|nr:peptidoglycan DD-metalloendopeptidase family protein [Tannerellaceae bacterium]